MQNRLLLPEGEKLLDASPPAASWLQELDGFLQRNNVSEGYVHITTQTREDLLLLFRGRPYLAGRFAEGQFARLELTRFFTDTQEAADRRVRICRSDMGLVLVLAVLAQHQPTMRVPLKLADVERILAEVQKSGQDAAIVLATPDERSFAFCRKGQVASVYFATPAAEGDQLADRFLSYLYTRPPNEPMLVEVYHQLVVVRDPHANRPIKDFLVASLEPLPVFLRVLKGREVTEKRLIRGGNVRIGRNPDNDIVINHPSVSREHVHIFWRNGAYHAQDMQSANGTLINGQPVREGELQFGDVLRLGDFEVAFEAEPAEQEGDDSDLHTMFIDAPGLQSVSAQIVMGSDTLRIETPVFTIGKSKAAALRVSGLFMRDVQATIVREGPGRYRLSAAEGGRAVKVNGQRVAFSGALLNSGDQFSVGPHNMLFALVSQG